jgi:hypothetical protein
MLRFIPAHAFCSLDLVFKKSCLLLFAFTKHVVLSAHILKLCKHREVTPVNWNTGLLWMLCIMWSIPRCSWLLLGWIRRGPVQQRLQLHLDHWRNASLHTHIHILRHGAGYRLCQSIQLHRHPVHDHRVACAAVWRSLSWTAVLHLDHRLHDGGVHV